MISVSGMISFYIDRFHVETEIIWCKRIIFSVSKFQIHKQ